MYIERVFVVWKRPNSSFVTSINDLVCRLNCFVCHFVENKPKTRLVCVFFLSGPTACVQTWFRRVFRTVFHFSHIPISIWSYSRTDQLNRAFFSFASDLLPIRCEAAFLNASYCFGFSFAKIIREIHSFGMIQRLNYFDKFKKVHFRITRLGILYYSTLGLMNFGKK